MEWWGSAPEARLDEEGRVQRVSFVWKVAGNAAHRDGENTILGHLEIEGERLVASVSSAGRAERIMELLMAACPGARHLGTEIETLEEAMHAEAERGRGGEPADDPATSDPEVRAQLVEMTARHYEDRIRSPRLRDNLGLREPAT